MSNQFHGKTAIISGSAGGIGFALAKEFGRLGMKIVLTDIDQHQLDNASAELSSENIEHIAFTHDVRSYDQWQKIVNDTENHFGAVHMIINNAGLGGVPETIGDVTLDAWRKTIDVNLFGVLYGAQAAIPAIKRTGEGGWMINVASIAGLQGAATMTSYSATKAAVLSMSEGWSEELKSSGIQVAVLCPLFVKTNLNQSSRDLHLEYRKDASSDGAGHVLDDIGKLSAMMSSGIDASVVAKRTVEAINNNQFYIFTHPFMRSLVSTRSKALDDAFVDAENSEFLKGLSGINPETMMKKFSEE